MSLKSTRKHDVALNLIGESVDLVKHIVIASKCLPTNKDVLLCLLANKRKLQDVEGRKKCHATTHQAVVAAYKQVQQHYEKAAIPMMSESGVLKKISDLHDRFNSVRKKRSEKSVCCFRTFLEQTLKVWEKGLEEKYKNLINKQVISDQRRQVLQEDLNFLENMEGDRTASYGGKDLTTKTKSPGLSTKPLKPSEPCTSKTIDLAESEASDHHRGKLVSSIY